MKSAILHRILPLLAATALIAGFSACSSKKNAAATSRTPSVVAKRTPSAGLLADTYTPWTSFYAPVSLSLEKPTSFNISGRATMEYGKYIHISLRVLGIEAGVVYVDTDSAFIIDKFRKMAISAALGQLTSATSITLEDLQGLLLGQAVYPGEGILHDKSRTEKFFSAVQADDGSILLTPRRTPGDAVWYYNLNTTPAITALNIEVNDKGNVTASFGDLQTTAAGNVAADIDFTATLNRSEIAASVGWNLDKAEWNSKRTASRPSLDSYKRIDAADLLKNLKF